MKSCLVSTDLPVRYRVQNFNNTDLNTIQSAWKPLKLALERAVDLVNSFGIEGDNLTSVNALIPVAYHLMHSAGGDLRGSTSFDVRNGTVIRKWLFTALLNGVFGGTSDAILGSIRTVLQSHKGNRSRALPPHDHGPWRPRAQSDVRQWHDGVRGRAMGAAVDPRPFTTFFLTSTSSPTRSPTTRSGATRNGSWWTSNTTATRAATGARR